jgi:hypothetical protein
MDNITVKINDPTNKNIKLGNIEPITNIKVVRDKNEYKKNNNNSESSSSSVSSESTEYSDSSSESSEHVKKKKKKVIKKSRNPNFQNNQQFNYNDYNSFSNPKKTSISNSFMVFPLSLINSHLLFFKTTVFSFWKS